MNLDFMQQQLVKLIYNDVLATLTVDSISKSS